MIFKSDKYRKTRGGKTKLLKLSCESCGYFLFYYQKDGPGILKRLYVDRIVSDSKEKFGKSLQCGKCGTLIGVAIIYKKERRPAIRLFAGAIAKKPASLGIVKNGWDFS